MLPGVYSYGSRRGRIESPRRPGPPSMPTRWRRPTGRPQLSPARPPRQSLGDTRILSVGDSFPWFFVAVLVQTPDESNRHSLCRHVFSPEGHYSAICALDFCVRRPRDTFTMSVPSRSRRRVNVAPGLRTTWRGAWSPACAASSTRASTMGASARKSAARDGWRGSSRTSSFHHAAFRSASVCLRNGNCAASWTAAPPWACQSAT